MNTDSEKTETETPQPMTRDEVRELMAELLKLCREAIKQQDAARERTARAQ